MAGVAVSEERVDDNDIEADEKGEVPEEPRCVAEEETDGVPTSNSGTNTNSFWCRERSDMRYLRHTAA